MNGIIKFLYIFLISFFFIPLLYSCAMPTISRFSADEQSREVEELFRTTTSISLAWNYDTPSEVDYFKMYYKPHGSNDWAYLDSTNTATPVFEISHDSVGDGSWDFGVTSINLSGTESDIHSSLDTTAEPDTGWYLLWKK